MGLWLAPWRHWQVWGRRGTLVLLSLTCRFPLEQLCWGALQQWLHPFSSHYCWWRVASMTAQDPHYPTEIVPLEPLHWFCICDKRSCFIHYSPALDNWSMLSMQTGHTKQPFAVDHRLWHCRVVSERLWQYEWRKVLSRVLVEFLPKQRLFFISLIRCEMLTFSILLCINTPFFVYNVFSCI